MKGKNNKPELIDETAIVVEASFELKKIELKDDLAWRMKIDMNTRLNHTFREYDVRLSLDETPYETRISDMERKREEVLDEASLFEGNKKQEAKFIDGQIQDIKDELAEKKAQCPDIEFKGVIEELKYKDAYHTIVVMMFPSDSLIELNAQKRELTHYKIELIRK